MELQLKTWLFKSCFGMPDHSINWIGSFVTFYQRFNQDQAFIAGLRWGSSLTELLDVSFSPAFSCSNSFELFLIHLIADLASFKQEIATLFIECVCNIALGL